MNNRLTEGFNRNLLSLLCKKVLEGNESFMNIIIQMGDSYPDESPCSKRMRTFYEAFVEAGHKVKVLAPKLSKEQENSKDIIYCPTFPLKSKNTLNRLMNSLGFAITSFFVSFKLGKIDIVITTSPPPLINIFGWMIAKIKRAKLVYDVRDIWPDVAWEMGSFTHESIYSRVFEFIRNFMLRHADLVTAVSEGKVDKLKGYAPYARIVHIPNGLDETFLTNSEDMELVHKYDMDNKFNCVYVGNLGLAQGLSQLMQVAKKAKEKYQDTQFLLFGSGVEENILRDYVRENELDNVIFAGRLLNSKMYTVLKYSQISFVSLVNENLRDSVPTKMFEALGVGCPVLLAAVGDSADILEASKLGLAVPPNDEKKLWDAFVKMHDQMDEIMINKGHAVKYILNNYSRQCAAREMERVLREI